MDTQRRTLLINGWRAGVTLSALAVAARGVATLAAVAEGGTPLPELPPPAGAVALFVGNESFGLEGPARDALDVRVTIPMADRVDSFSVNAAVS